MNSCHQVFKKLVLGTTLMCCAGMSTVEAGPWDWLKNLFAGEEIAKLSKDVVRLERKVKGLERSNKVKTCIIVTSVAGCVVAGCYCFFKKRPGTAENAIQDGETPIPLQQEEETPVLALEEEQGETQVQDLNTAENETRIENEAPVQPRVGLVVSEVQSLALCIEDETQLTEVGKAIGNDVALLGGQNVPQSDSALIETIRNLSKTIEENSKTMTLQEKNIKELIIVIRDGQRAAIKILERCGRVFVPTQGYAPDWDEIENQNTEFLSSPQNFHLVQYVSSTSEQDVETKSEVDKLSSISLDIWNQCLSGVKEKENQNEEAIALEQKKAKELQKSFEEARTEVSKLSEANLALQQENKGAMDQVMALQKENIEAKKATQQAEQKVTQIQAEKENLAKANELSSAEVQKLNTQLEEAQREVQTITNKIRTQTVGVETAIQAVQNLKIQQGQKDKVMSVLSSLKKGSIK